MTSKFLTFAFAFILLALVTIDHHQETSIAAQARELQEPKSTTTSFSMALTGDSIITRKLSPYEEPDFLKLITLLRGADAAFTNLEVLFHDYEAYPMSQSGGTYMRADPSLAGELAWAGFDLVSRANNHTGDFGVTGMRLTTQYVKKAGMVEAGVGESLAEAREAKFLETKNGRIALISVASTFPDHSRAGKTRGDIPARPGLNPLRFSSTYVVTREQLETLRKLMREMNFSPPRDGDQLSFLQNNFIVGDKPDIRTEPSREDVEEITAIIRNARRLADYTLVTIHAHEGNRNKFIPAEFLVTFARIAIDAGADVVVGHGPHVLRGIEIYKGKPILYSLGNFIFQAETLLRLPVENYERLNLGPTSHVGDYQDQLSDFDRKDFPAEAEVWESVVAVPRWKGKKLVALELHPITLGFGTPRTERGRPMLANPDLSKKIIGDITRLSRTFGTTILFSDGIGKVSLPADGENPRPN